MWSVRKARNGIYFQSAERRRYRKTGGGRRLWPAIHRYKVDYTEPLNACWVVLLCSYCFILLEIVPQSPAPRNLVCTKNHKYLASRIVFPLYILWNIHIREYLYRIEVFGMAVSDGECLATAFILPSTAPLQSSQRTDIQGSWPPGSRDFHICKHNRLPAVAIGFRMSPCLHGPATQVTDSSPRRHGRAFQFLVLSSVCIASLNPFPLPPGR